MPPWFLRSTASDLREGDGRTAASCILSRRSTRVVGVASVLWDLLGVIFIHLLACFIPLALPSLVHGSTLHLILYLCCVLHTLGTQPQFSLLCLKLVLSSFQGCNPLTTSSWALVSCSQLWGLHYHPVPVFSSAVLSCRHAYTPSFFILGSETLHSMQNNLVSPSYIKYLCLWQYLNIIPYNHVKLKKNLNKLGNSTWLLDNYCY